MQKKGNKIDVKEMGFESFYDLKTLIDDMGLNIAKNVDGNEFKINEVKILEFQKGSELIRYKTSYGQAEWSSLNFKAKRRRSDLQDIKNVTLKKAYSKPLQLSENKKGI
ncbi:unnamed protein product [Psylliodes chrysocephalus]|uniref:Uncharacterized protein n=1 Tax=Psylliodes chrysocephalus TaxID=3402493 RepID=A0A9P0GAN2_9CUCU|nr:unnamed protein product [Psylliodes chrysocephala]